jgi:hypothetical protein
LVIAAWRAAVLCSRHCCAFICYISQGLAASLVLILLSGGTALRAVPFFSC